MALGVHITLLGVADYQAALERWAEILEDIREVAPEVFAYLEQQQKQNFEGEGLTYHGGPWPVLSPAYKRWKSRHYPGKKILHLTGELKRSLTQRKARHAIRQELGPRSLAFGSRDPKAVWHNEGVPQNKLPRRTVFIDTRADAQAIVDILRDALEAA